MNSTIQPGGTAAGSGRAALSAPATAVALSTGELVRVANRELLREQKVSKGNQRLILRSAVPPLSDAGW